MEKYRNTKIVKSILLRLPVLFCSCNNNDSSKNGHFEDERDLRLEDGEVKTGKIKIIDYDNNIFDSDENPDQHSNIKNAINQISLLMLNSFPDLFF